MAKVLGVSSLCFGDMYHLKDSLHLFMCDFDNVNLEDVLIEAKRIHEQFNIDIYIIESSYKNFHLISFDVLKWRLVQTIQANITIKTDFPLINMRYGITMDSASKLDYKCFLTLRIGEKLLKPSPNYITRFVKPNKYVKSIKHYGLYMEFCNIPDSPKWYKDNWVKCKVLISEYNTEHNLSVSKNDSMLTKDLERTT